MKRICLYGASDSLGGTEIYLITMIRALKDDVRFDLLVHHNYGAIPFENEILSYGGKVYREYYKNSERKLPDYLSPEKILAKHPEWDGIYLNLQKIDTSYRLLIEAEKKGIPYRIIHSHSCKYFHKIGLKDKIFELYYKLTRKSVITHCLCCSKPAGQWLFGNKRKLTIIPNSIDFEKFHMNEQVRSKMRKSFQILNDEIVVGFCGRLDEIKRPLFLLDIFYHLKKHINCKLLLVGDGYLKEAVHEKAKQLDLLQSVIFTGSVENTSDYYQMMDCFVLPSKFEGFGIVLLEAQAAGLQCFTTDRAVPYETNVTGRVSFISGDLSAEQWAEYILKKGFDRVDCLEILQESDYTITAMKRKLLDVFRDE